MNIKHIFAQASGWLREHIIPALLGSAALSAALSSVCTLAATDYFNHRKDVRAQVQVEYDKTKAVQLDLDNVLQKFADKAVGAGSTTADDLEALRKAIKSEVANAEQLTLRLPAVRPDFVGLTEALVALQDTVYKLEGPGPHAGGRDFVKAVDAYYVARKHFNERAIEAQRRWALLD